MPSALLLLALAPRLLLVRATLLRRLTPATRGRLSLLRLSMLARLPRLPGLLTPAALLRGLVLSRRLTVRGLTVRGLALLRLLRGLSPAAALALARGLLSPATLLWRLAALSPVLPAWLAPRLPRTPWSLRRRRHMCSF
ncbi:hypothetical protein EV649_6616 [Kribbella sp. VKM Ac-2569]|nr:hypothetical protein EV649_6616 [Kribbella sp. VKM Ac-2569]